MAKYYGDLIFLQYDYDTSSQMCGEALKLAKISCEKSKIFWLARSARSQTDFIYFFSGERGENCFPHPQQIFHLIPFKFQHKWTKIWLTN